LPILVDRFHLPLRGKLGWMTPRSGVKTTPEMRRGLSGSNPKRGPHYLVCEHDRQLGGASPLHNQREVKG